MYFANSKHDMNKFRATVLRLKQESEQRKILKQVDYIWVNNKLLELGITRKTIIQDLLLDKSTLSLLLNGNRKFNKTTKAAFYYYFAYKELVRQNKMNKPHILES